MVISAADWCFMNAWRKTDWFQQSYTQVLITAKIWRHWVLSRFTITIPPNPKGEKRHFWHKSKANSDPFSFSVCRCYVSLCRLWVFVLPCFVWQLWESWPHRRRRWNNWSLLAPCGSVTMTRSTKWGNSISLLVLRDKSTGEIPH